LLINADNEASSTSGGGLGGEVDAAADRDLTISGVVKITTNGHTSADNFGGDGGPQTYVAGRNLNVGAAVKIEAEGAMPDGFGEDIFFESAEAMTIAGSTSARGRGAQGGGGTISTDSGNAFNATSSSVFDVTGGSSGGGAVEFVSVGSITFDGVVDGQASNGGSPDTVLFLSNADLATTGDVLLNGGPAGIARGDVELEACRINLNAGTLLSNLGGAGTTTLVAHERVTVNTGAVVTNAANGFNRLFYRTSDKPPVVLGLVTPAFQLAEDPTLSGCPICGNNEVEGGETCDDGNQAAGDGCSSNCQDEGCIADTAGYPDTPLCDDGQDCTYDACNTDTHSCEHELNCEDGNECTVDACVNEACVHTQNDALCDDDNSCTLDICGGFGCTYGLANGPCDDGLSCTTGDACSGGECAGTNACPSGQTCSATSGVCEDGGGGCGDPTGDGRTTASDALFALNVAVGLQTCSPCACDVDRSSTVSASDALRLLNFAVGLPGVMLDCPTTC
jgi:cysteine-rich repeat protein